MTNRLNALVQPVTLLARSQDQVSCDVSGETVILSLKTAQYYGLDPVATRVWELLKNANTVSQMCESLLSEYDVDPERCTNEVIALTEQLINWQLVEFAPVSSRVFASQTVHSTESRDGL